MDKEEMLDGFEALLMLNIYEFFSKKMPIKEDRDKLFDAVFKGYLKQSEWKNLR